jgi:hypothetical protein
VIRKRDREGQAFVDQMMYMVVGPFIGFPGWEDELRNHKTEILLQRMLHSKEVFETQQSTEFEAMLYVSTASLAHPIGHDWAQIYMWLFKRWQPEAAQKLQIEPDRPELNVNQQEDLARLRRWIFKHQMDHIKRKTRGEPAPTPAGEPELVQMSFFPDEPKPS